MEVAMQLRSTLLNDLSVKGKLESSCMGQYRPYLTGFVMQRSSIVSLSLMYPW